jgi:hypothetical protein
VPGLLGLVFQRLPRGEQAFTVGALSREWHAWAAPRRAALAGEDCRCTAAPPLWLIQEAWPGLDNVGRSNACVRAAGDAALCSLQWLYQQGCPWGGGTCEAAARGGHLEVLQWAREQGCPWDEETCSLAAFSGHLEVLQWARQHGCRWSEETCEDAIFYGHLQVLQWAHQQGGPFDKAHCLALAKVTLHTEVVEWLTSLPD